MLVLAAAAILETGVVMATVRWTPTGSNLKSLVFLTGLAFAALLAGVVVRALRSQLDWLAERGAPRDSATSKRRWRRRPSGPASPARCTTWSRTTSR